VRYGPRALKVIRALAFGLVVACGAAPDAHVQSTDAEINARWIGGACRSAEECPFEGGVCLPDSAGFPGGHCSRPCESRCPDEAGTDRTETFCTANRSGEGTCVSRCDFTKLPGTGCRPGYGCTRVSRMGDPAKIVESCMPLRDGTAAALNDLQPRLERAAREANLASERIVLVDVTDGASPLVAQIRGASPVYPASVIKVPVMVEIEHQIEQGQLARETTLPVGPDDDTCDTPPAGDTRPTIAEGDFPRVDFLLDVMITRSDNTAANTLIQRAGRANVTSYMASLGLSGIALHRKVYGCDPIEDTAWDGVHMNTMTAIETAKLYQLILDGGPGFVGPEGRAQMQKTLSEQRYKSIGTGLPSDAVFLNKTGSTSQVAHDTGIILWRGRRYIVAAFTELAPAVGRPRLGELGHQIGHILQDRL
jgi:beta-lactamase class A